MDERNRKKILVQSFTEHLTCVLCGGYFIDATAITECLHTFCKTCIIGYLETSVFCPVCDAQVHETKPTLSLRRDQTLQNVVYKLVPGLLSNEIKRRKEFIEQRCDPGDSGICDESASIIDENIDGRFYREDEQISVCLQFNPYGKSIVGDKKKHKHRSRHCKRVPRRFLLCPAPFSIGHCKKFLRTKHDLSNNNRSNTLKVAIFHSDEALPDHYTLMDVAYIYTWRRTGPLRLYYSFYEGSDPPLPPMKMPRPRRQENIEDWNKLEGFFDSPPSSPSSLGSRSSSPDTLHPRGSCSPVFDRFPSFLSSGRHLSALSSHLSFKQNGSRLDLSASKKRGGRWTSRGAGDDEWREPTTKKIKQEEPEETGASTEGSSGQAPTENRCGVERSPSGGGGALATHPKIPDTLRFTPLTKVNISRASAFRMTTPPAYKAPSAVAATNARLSLSVTLPKNFIKDLLIARDMEKLVKPKIKTEAP